MSTYKKHIVQGDCQDCQDGVSDCLTSYTNIQYIIYDRPKCLML